MSLHRHSVAHALGLVLALMVAARPPVAAQQPLSLSAEDKKHLDGLMKDFLYDPDRAERVSVKVIVRTVWTGSNEEYVDGWLVAGKDGKPGTVFFTDGASIPAPPAEKMKKVDFVAMCQARYARAANKEMGKDSVDTFRNMKRVASGEVLDDDLVMAAWLYRLGQEPLAARALAATRKGKDDPNNKDDPRKRLRGELAWSAFAGMVHAFMVRADDEALAHGERLLRLYADEATATPFSQAALIIEDLKRRRQKGTFGKEPGKTWPDGFDNWDAKKKVAFLIDALDEVDARQNGQPGGVDLASDRRVAELIHLGDVAVPDLIDALEKDKRLTRSVHFWRDFARDRTVMAVSEAALTALMSILRTQIFDPVSTGDNFTSRGEEAAKSMAQTLRAYWKEYGNLPFDERMMKVLTDAKTKFEAKREAAENLAHLGRERPLRTTFGPSIIGGEPAAKPNPAIAKFTNPTVAQAILSAMDADLKAYAAAPAKDASMVEYYRRQIEGTYLDALSELDDQRIAPEAAQRATAALTTYGRQQWAAVALDLGDSKPLEALSDDFRLGKVLAPTGDHAARDLAGLIGTLVYAKLPAADRALNSLTDAKHPLHETATRQVLSQRIGDDYGRQWFSHPFCLRILRAALDDTTPTGARYIIVSGSLRREHKGGSQQDDLPDFLADATNRRNEAKELACDVAAEKVTELVAGLAQYHPLFKDAEKRRETLKKTLQRFDGRFRRATWHESEMLGMSPWSPHFMADIRPLDHAATAEDVTSGKAIFHLDGKGKLADLKPPAVCILRRDEKQQYPPRLLIVQAEVRADGEIMFGVITQHDMRAVAARAVSEVKTFAELDKEAKEKN